jgi:hypothetical protein
MGDFSKVSRISPLVQATLVETDGVFERRAHPRQGCRRRRKQFGDGFFLSGPRRLSRVEAMLTPLQSWPPPSRLARRKDQSEGRPDCRRRFERQQ